MAVKSNPRTPDSVVIIGSNVSAIQSALSLAQMGIDVTIVTDRVSLDFAENRANITDFKLNKHLLRPLLLRATSHPRVTVLTNSEVDSIEGKKGNFRLQVTQRPRYIEEALCTNCKRCQAVCSARITTLVEGEKLVHPAIHAPIFLNGGVPSAYTIDKDGVAPCQAACPLGINIQGFVSLLASGKDDKALALINEKAPLAGILGRVCKHPCEEKCNRSKVDKPLSIRSLHRFAADNAGGGIVYKKRDELVATKLKIAIIGSGPAGLTAAWDLTRRGYSPVVFESHSVIGGMLATGIPRFRLPKEVREREIEAIIKLGVNIRTGITVGRDITLTYLKERGYNTFFLAIGTQQNNKLNIPGEDLDGVVDCLSLLLTLNLKVDTFVGSKVVIVGGGNAAIDSARVALRSGAQKVTIAYRRTRDEMPADPEEVIEALKEGINIEFQVIPVEILGHNSTVASVRCQKTRRITEILENGQHKFEPIPGTELVIEADHVVVAVGQSPNAAQLGFEGLKIDERTGVIKVDPLTLETSISGIFAGGDCVTGPNNVVDAMAAGLRAAESMDRFIQGRDLAVRRNIEPPQTADVDFDLVEIRPFKRAIMPVLPLQKRKNSFEETTTGLSPAMADKEAQRCLNCGLCSQCMECVTVCEAGAVVHTQSIKHIELAAQAVLKFPEYGTRGIESGNGKPGLESVKKGIYMIPPGEGALEEHISRAMASSFEIARDIISPVNDKKHQKPFDSTDNVQPGQPGLTVQSGEKRRAGVFLCRCNGSIDAVIDFQAISRNLISAGEVICVSDVAQACVESGSEQMAAIIRDKGLDTVVVAACRCCNLDQICYSCSDRRRMCLQFLSHQLESGKPVSVEYVNIRENCAWLYKNQPDSATTSAFQIITSGVARAKLTPFIARDKKPGLPHVVITGFDEASLAAAKALVWRGFQVTFLSSGKPGLNDSVAIEGELEELLVDNRVTVKQMPDAVRLNGPPGNYSIELQSGADADRIKTGAMLVSLPGLKQSDSEKLRGVLGKVVAQNIKSNNCTNFTNSIFRSMTIYEDSGIFIIQKERDPVENLRQAGVAAAKQISTFLEQADIAGCSLPVQIDEKLCRGCGDCSVHCPYIEMKNHEDGTLYAYVEPALCMGCGTCISCCPAGAITQLAQSDEQIAATLGSMLSRPRILSAVYE